MGFLQKIIAEHCHYDWSFTIEGVQFEDLRQVVRFMYSGNALLNSHQVGSFLVVASLLGMKWVDKVTLMSEQNSNSILMNESNELNHTTDTISSQQSVLPFKDITNVQTSRILKRQKSDRNKKHNVKSKLMKIEHGKRSKDYADENERPVTNLAQMDENTFCTAFGLKKNVEVRDNVKPEGAKFVRKSMPPLFKIISSVKAKCSETVEVSETTNLASDSCPVFIEAKNLSFLNIDTNELCIRENNIEIECDVLDVASHELLMDKSANVQISEGRYIVIY